MNANEFIHALGADPDSLAEMAEVLDRLAISAHTGTPGEAQTLYWRLQYYVVQTSFEIRSLFAAIVAVSGVEERYTPIDKYLGLVAYEAVDVLPKLTGRLIKALAQETSSNYDAGKIKNALREFLKKVRSAPVDQDSVALVRNAVAAHHLDKAGDLDVLAEWYGLTREFHQQGLGPLEVKLNVYAAHIERCLVGFNNELVASDMTSRPEDIRPVG